MAVEHGGRMAGARAGRRRGQGRDEDLLQIVQLEGMEQRCVVDDLGQEHLADLACLRAGIGGRLRWRIERAGEDVGCNDLVGQCDQVGTLRAGSDGGDGLAQRDAAVARNSGHRRRAHARTGSGTRCRRYAGYRGRRTRPGIRTIGRMQPPRRPCCPRSLRRRTPSTAGRPRRLAARNTRRRVSGCRGNKCLPCSLLSVDERNEKCGSIMALPGAGAA
jgi:hypothetical protein